MNINTYSQLIRLQTGGATTEISVEVLKNMEVYLPYNLFPCCAYTQGTLYPITDILVHTCLLVVFPIGNKSNLDVCKLKMEYIYIVYIYLCIYVYIFVFIVKKN